MFACVSDFIPYKLAELKQKSSSLEQVYLLDPEIGLTVIYIYLYLCPHGGALDIRSY